jgi:hypothetical protein
MNNNDSINTVTKWFDDAIRSTALAMAEASNSASGSTMQIERLGEDSNGDMWIRSFLINSNRNQRGWAVNRSTLRKNATSIIGKPLVLYKDPETGRIDHYPWNTLQSAEANIKDQEKYAVGRVEKVYYDLVASRPRG